MTTIYMTLTRFAVMSGAYGNLPALEACITDSEEQQCRVRFFLGNAIGAFGNSDAVLDIIRNNFEITLAGNLEQEAALGSDGGEFGFTDPEDVEYSRRGFRYALESLGDVNRTWLGSWPEKVVLVLPRGRVLFVHGSPERSNEFLFESELDEERLLRWMDEERVFGLICDHTGLPWVRALPGGRFAANVGAVGLPANDGDPAAHYAIVDLLDLDRPVEIRRVEYPHDHWADRVEADGVDPAFTEPLRTGFWRIGVASLPEAERRAAEARRTSS